MLNFVQLNLQFHWYSDLFMLFPFLLQINFQTSQVFCDFIHKHLIFATILLSLLIFRFFLQFPFQDLSRVFFLNHHILKQFYFQHILQVITIIINFN